MRFKLFIGFSLSCVVATDPGESVFSHDQHCPHAVPFPKQKTNLEAGQVRGKLDPRICFNEKQNEKFLSAKEGDENKQKTFSKHKYYVGLRWLQCPTQLKGSVSEASK